MKAVLVLSAFFLISTHAFAGQKKQIWNCQNDVMKISVTLTESSLNGHLVDDLNGQEKGTKVSLSPKRAGQTNGLTGSLRTELKGEVRDWDSYAYQITLIRNNVGDFHMGGSRNETLRANALVEINAELDCAGEEFNVVLLDCQVRVVRK